MVIGTVTIQLRVQLPLAVLRYAHAVGQYEVELEPGKLVVWVLQHNTHLLAFARFQRHVSHRQVVGHRPAHQGEQDG